MRNQCPFCGNYAYAAPVGDAYRMDCRYCEIQVEITKRAYAARCPNPVAVLGYIKEKMKGSTRPRVDLADMKRLTPPPSLEEESTTSHPEQAQPLEAESDLLTTAAKAIGTTLGKIAIRTGFAPPPAPVSPASKVRKVAAKKKTPAAKVAAGAKRKTASIPSARKAAPPAKGKKPARRRRQGK